MAVIDLGSNSWRLVVFTYQPGPPSDHGPWWKRTDELYETVRIGAGLGATGRLSNEAISRGLETLTVFERFCRANGLGPEDVHAVATSAIRDASNRADFVRRAERRTGLRIEVLSEDDEAFFGYVAAINTSTMTDGDRARDRRRQPTADPGRRPPGARAGLVPAGRGASDRGAPPGSGAGQEEGARAGQGTGT